MVPRRGGTLRRQYGWCVRVVENEQPPPTCRLPAIQEYPRAFGRKWCSFTDRPGDGLWRVQLVQEL
jgi:hypothetical protein